MVLLPICLLLLQGCLSSHEPSVCGTGNPVEAGDRRFCVYRGLSGLAKDFSCPEEYPFHADFDDARVCSESPVSNKDELPKPLCDEVGSGCLTAGEQDSGTSPPTDDEVRETGDDVGGTKDDAGVPEDDDGERGETKEDVGAPKDDAGGTEDDGEAKYDVGVDGGGGSASTSHGPKSGSVSCATATASEPTSACNEGRIDHECDSLIEGAWYACGDGHHIDTLAGTPCPVCVPNTPEARSCEWGQDRYASFLDELIYNSCFNACDTDDDCAVWELSSACLSNCRVSLNGYIDEELMIAAEQFAEESCGGCGSQPFEMQLLSGAKCINHHCSLEIDMR